MKGSDDAFLEFIELNIWMEFIKLLLDNHSWMFKRSSLWCD
jgi:hypothetical protein